MTQKKQKAKTPSEVAQLTAQAQNEWENFKSYANETLRKSFVEVDETVVRLQGYNERNAVRLVSRAHVSREDSIRFSENFFNKLKTTFPTLSMYSATRDRDDNHVELIIISRVLV